MLLILIRALRRGLRLLTMLAIIISVLVACNTGDSPLTVQPLSPNLPLQSSSQDADPLLALLPQSLQSSTSLTTADHGSQLLASSVLTHLKRPYGLAWDGSSFVIAEFGFSLGSSGLRIIPADGSPPSFLGAGQLGRLRDVLLEGDHYLALDGGYGHPGRLFQLPRSGGDPTVIASGLGAAISLAPINPGVYVVTNVEGQLLRVDHGQVSQIANGLGVLYGVAVVDPETYLVTDLAGARILRVTAGGEVTPVVTTGLEMPRDIQRESSGSYVVVDMGLTPGQGRLLRMFESGELEVIEDQGMGNPTGVAIVEPDGFGVTDFTGNRLLRVEEDLTPVQPGTVVILNAEEIDGQPLTVGDSITLQAQARDLQGQDVTAQIEWRDQDGNVLESGGNLTYEATETQMLTITASVGEERDRVSTTISPEDVTVAPHVKVLSDQVADRVKLVDEEGGIIRLVDEELSYPTIRESDVVIGANGLVPPMKVLGISREDGDLVLSVVAALPKEVIEYGSATFEQTIDWSENGQVVQIHEHPSYLFSIGDSLEPKWPDYAEVGEPISAGGTITAVANLDWRPLYQGALEFDQNSGNGIKRFFLSQNSSFSFAAGLRADGVFEWDDQTKAYRALADKSEFIPVHMGPVPILISLKRVGYLLFVPTLKNYGLSQITYSQIGSNLSESIDYSSDDTEDWVVSAELVGGEWDTSVKEETNFWGRLGVVFGAHIDIDVAGLLDHSREFRYYLVGTSGHPKAEVLLSDSLEGISLGDIQGQTEIEISVAASYEQSAINSNDLETFGSLVSKSNEEEDSVSLQYASPIFDPEVEDQLDSGIGDLPQPTDDIPVLNPWDPTDMDWDPGEPGWGIFTYFVLRDMFDGLICPTPKPTRTPCPEPSDECKYFWSFDMSVDEYYQAIEDYKDKCTLPFLKGQFQCYSHEDNILRKDCYLECDAGYQSHHIVQDAAVKGIGKYKTKDAPTVLLCGGDAYPGTPHDCAGGAQSPRPGGILSHEIILGKHALEAALSCVAPDDPRENFTRQEIDYQVDCAEKYFYSELGLPSSTNTNAVTRG